MVATALAFAYLLNKYEGNPLATHAVVREMVRKNATGLDEFLSQHINYSDVESSIRNSIEVLPGRVQNSVMLDISEERFRSL
jgi:3-hydroxyisobutyrate dehydrogenase